MADPNKKPWHWRVRSWIRDIAALVTVFGLLKGTTLGAVVGGLYLGIVAFLLQQLSGVTVAYLPFVLVGAVSGSVVAFPMTLVFHSTLKRALIPAPTRGIGTPPIAEAAEVEGTAAETRVREPTIGFDLHSAQVVGGGRCLFVMSVTNRTQKALRTQRWSARLLIDGKGYQLFSVRKPEEPTEGPDGFVLMPDEHIDSRTSSVEPGDRATGWLIAGCSTVSEEMFDHPNAEYHFVGTGGRHWSGPRASPQGGFLGPSVEPSEESAPVNCPDKRT